MSTEVFIFSISTILLKIFGAIVTSLATIYEATNTGKIAHFNFGDFIAHFCNSSNYFMTRNRGIFCAAPIVTSCVKVTMANATKENFNFYIFRHYITALNFHWFQICIFGFCAESFYIFC